jgi:23S rRNA pseudouridine2605 synthase
MVLNTGLKRQIRYMIQAVGHRVKRLVRLKIGELTLDTLKPGKWRILGKSEQDALMALSDKKRGSRK